MPDNPQPPSLPRSYPAAAAVAAVVSVAFMALMASVSRLGAGAWLLTPVLLWWVAAVLVTGRLNMALIDATPQIRAYWEALQARRATR